MPLTESLKYNFDVLESCVTRMGNIAVNTDDIKNELCDICVSMGSSWKGEAHNAFAERTKRLIENLDTLYNQVIESREKMDKAVAIQKANEENIGNSTVGNLNVGNIF